MAKQQKEATAKAMANGWISKDGIVAKVVIGSK
jgi:hypothetical protein